MATVAESPAALRLEVRDFLSFELAAGSFVPSCNAWMSAHDPAFTRKLGERGWIGMTWPRKYGGGGYSALDRYAVVEELLAAGAPVAAHWFADRQVGPQLLKFGTEEQRMRFLPAIAAGECLFAIGMSEPEAGSDLAAVRTTARAADGGWLVSGRKVWTSHAHKSQFMVTLCRSGGASDDRHEGLTQLIVALDADGVTIAPIPGLDGQTHFAEVSLDAVFVPDADVVGEVGDGWRQVTAELAFERSGPERFLSVLPLLRDATGGHDRAAGPPLETLARLFSRLIALRRLSLDVARGLDEGADLDLDAALVKDLGTVFEQDAVSMLRSIHSAPGDAPFRERLAELQLAAPGFTLRGGTTEVLRHIIGGLVTRR
jgi:acyl-CoA dehydrogenase